jgi:ribosome-associated toxin RatA of RatAB toxin-antitoxin module
MTQTPARTYQQSIVIRATPEAVYDLVSDITRTGEWSPVCKACWWDDAGEAGQVGAWFTGRNELPERTWETRSQIAAADRGREFAWIVGRGLVRWSFTFEPEGADTRLTETWQFLAAGIAMFQQTYGDRAGAEVEARTRQAHDGIPQTLAAIKRIAESS